MTSDRYDLRLLGTPPPDINPHRFYTKAEVDAIIADCEADTKRSPTIGNVIDACTPAVRERQAQRRRRSRTRRDVALGAVLVAVAVLMLLGPSLLPLAVYALLLGLCALGAVVGIATGAGRGNVTW